jgi:hypothetical protein
MNTDGGVAKYPCLSVFIRGFIRSSIGDGSWMMSIHQILESWANLNALARPVKNSHWQLRTLVYMLNYF